MSSELLLWVGFGVFVVFMMVLDLGIFHRSAHAVSIREALVWCAVWIGLALLFNLGIYFWKGPVKALEFLAGYLIEEALSVDNLFVFLLIFTYFRVDRRYQHRVLFWGILGAIVMRAIFIGMGVALIQRFHWIIYIFGAFLVLTGIKMATQGEKELRPERNPVLKLFRKWMPVTEEYVEGRFFVRRHGRSMATPLFVVLLLVESTDLVFAVDSIPAVLAISHDPLIVYTSNIFAIMGLRSIFFALAGIIQLFHYLQYGLSIILIFVGMKMVLSNIYKIPVGIALGVVAGILAISVVASMLWPPKNLDEPPVKVDPSGRDESES